MSLTISGVGYTAYYQVKDTQHKIDTTQWVGNQTGVQTTLTGQALRLARKDVVVVSAATYFLQQTTKVNPTTSVVAPEDLTMSNGARIVVRTPAKKNV